MSIALCATWHATELDITQLSALTKALLWIFDFKEKFTFFITMSCMIFSFSLKYCNITTKNIVAEYVAIPSENSTSILSGSKKKLLKPIVLEMVKISTIWSSFYYKKLSGALR